MSLGKLSIGCMASQINEKYQRQILACINTWGAICDSLAISTFYFCGNYRVDDQYPDKIIHLPNVNDDVQSATDKQWFGLKWMYENSPSEWYLLAGTDNYVFPQRILDMLKKYDPSQAFFIGGHNKEEDTPVGRINFFTGAGFFLSHKALSLLLDDIPTIKIKWISLCKDKWWLYVACDVAMTYLCRQKPITFIKIEGIHACDWQGYEKSLYERCCHINYNKCLILHRCDNHLDHYAVKRYDGNTYLTLYRFLHEWKRNGNLRPIMDKLYQIGTTISGIRDLSSRINHLSGSVLRGLIDSLSEHKVFISDYSNETISKWIDMAKLERSGNADFLIIPVEKLEKVSIDPEVKFILTYEKHSFPGFEDLGDGLYINLTPH